MFIQTCQIYHFLDKQVKVILRFALPSTRSPPRGLVEHLRNIKIKR